MGAKARLEARKFSIAAEPDRSTSSVPLRTSRLLVGLATLLAGCAGAPRAPGDLTAWEAERIERLEAALAASPTRVRDPVLLDYLGELLRRLAPAGAPRLYVVEASAPQADLLGARVLRLRTGLLAAVANEDELAFVLAHELAHDALGHTQARRQAGWDATRAELEADAAAAQALARLGYQAGAGRALLRRLAGVLPEHQQLGARIAALPGLAVAHTGATTAFRRALGPYRVREADR